MKKGPERKQKVTYVETTDSFVVDGRVIKGNQLTATDKATLLKEAKQGRMIIEVPPTRKNHPGINENA